MTKSVWRKLVEAMPKNLTLAQASKLLRYSQSLTRLRMNQFGYKFRRDRKNGASHPPVWVQLVNRRKEWKRSNDWIGKKYGKSRERVRQYRSMLDIPKVEARGRKKNPVCPGCPHKVCKCGRKNS